MPTPRAFDFIGRTKKIGSKYFVANIDGSFTMLTEEEYRNLLLKNLDKELFLDLESKGVIITSKNIDVIAGHFRRRRQVVYQGPNLHIVIPTLRCNQVCLYCHAASRRMDAKDCDMDKETAKKTVEFIFQTPSRPITIEFQGGEPLVKFDIIKYMHKYANELNKKYEKDIRFSIVSNLTLMDDKKLDFITKNIIGLCTSLDGPKYVHDKNRKMIGGSGSYNLVTNWIQTFNQGYKEGYAKLNALATITRHSLPYPKEIIDEYKDLGLRGVWLRWVDPFGFAGFAWDKISYSAEEFLEFWKKGVDYVYDELKGFKELSSLILLRKIFARYEPAFLDILNPCGAGIGQMAYMHDGSIYSCDEGRMYGGDFFKLGNVNQSFSKVMSSPKMCSLIASSVSESYFCDHCVYQPYCGVCPVWNFADTGTVVPKLSMDLRCKILTGQFDYLINKYFTNKKFQKTVDKLIKLGDSQIEKNLCI